MSSYSADHSHWNSFQSLGDWLKKHNVPALYGLDTRSLTKRIREHGAVLGKIELPGQVRKRWRENIILLSPVVIMYAFVSEKLKLFLQLRSQAQVFCFLGRIFGDFSAAREFFSEISPARVIFLGTFFPPPFEFFLGSFSTAIIFFSELSFTGQEVFEISRVETDRASWPDPTRPANFDPSREQPG